MIQFKGSSNFKPSSYLPGGHLQTLARKYRAFPTALHSRQRIELQDGDFIDIDWTHGDGLPGADKERPIVVVLHGLCGSSKSPYVQALQVRLQAMNFTSAAVNFRGCSGEINRLARAYHSGATEDLHEVLENLARQHGARKFALVGYSLGANVLLKWLGENQASPLVERAIAISTPFSLSRCSQAMQKGLSKLYGQFFLRRLVAEMNLKTRHFLETGNTQQWQILKSLGDPRSLTSIWQFDDRVTAALHGFDGAEDYYEKCSSIHFLDKIRQPTLLIQSMDDPIIPSATLPVNTAANPCLQVALSASGGHVGFVSGEEPHWLERRVIEFLDKD